jgi:TolA-binding protein
MNKKLSLLILLASTSLYPYETSAFGAGNLNSSSPYGLTDTEQYIYENKKVISTNEKLLNEVADDVETLKVRYIDQNNKIKQFKESVSTLQNIIDAEGQKLHKQFFKLNDIDTTLQKLYKNDESFEQKFKDLVSKYDEELKNLKEENNNNIEKFKKVLDELSRMVSSINSSYETKQNVDILRDDFIHFTKTYKNGLNNGIESRLSKIEKEQKLIKILFKTDDKILEEAKRLFSSKDYESAITLLEALENKNYKKAEVLFRLAESNFYSTNYNNAMYYYKKSMDLDDKAPYLATLLYHTGVSCLKTSQKSKAELFFKIVVEQFPDSNEAKLSSKYVKSNPKTKKEAVDSNSSQNTKKDK